jgi:hypothetical protein
VEARRLAQVGLGPALRLRVGRRTRNVRVCRVWLGLALEWVIGRRERCLRVYINEAGGIWGTKL